MDPGKFMDRCGVEYPSCMNRNLVSARIWD